MATQELLLDFSDRMYAWLLTFYPRRFRVRYASEMRQVFRDCSRFEPDTLAALWMQALHDFAFSIVREWHREWNRPDPEIDYTGLVDTFMISLVVGTNLIGWGWMGAAVVLNSTFPGILAYWQTAATVIAFVVVTLTMAALIGFLCAFAVSRASRIERPRIHF